MSRFHVEVAEIDQAVVTVASLAEFSETLLSQIDRIAAVVGAEWSGEAAAQFKALHAEWVKGASEMSAGIKVMHVAATGSGTNYAAAIESSRGVWG